MELDIYRLIAWIRLLSCICLSDCFTKCSVSDTLLNFSRYKHVFYLHGKHNFILTAKIFLQRPSSPWIICNKLWQNVWEVFLVDCSGKILLLFASVWVLLYHYIISCSHSNVCVPLKSSVILQTLTTFLLVTDSLKLWYI